MDFKVGDKVRVKSEYNEPYGGYSYTKIGSEGVVETIMASSCYVKFYKYTGRKPLKNEGNIFDIAFSDLELVREVKQVNTHRRIVL
jgi:hypothetical protein